ncbi:beta-1,6-glucan synthase [Azoarcus indigens]|uniref:Endo-1,3-beta-glucanase btgC n=1 Tax=Azoarcus indigens TaxID=29545 RepID=A0A4R6EGX1_9RHOO|nr:beta-1,6-glucan synthase [Azoarcus indigens]NMG66238.1 beta-1,6-glucan synthase [Azoarcus indigens]TDN56647.1 glucan 1,3-beta-glucosidase [Azoarcus indigens]
MTQARPSNRKLWYALLSIHLLILAGLLAWMFLQTRPIAMHDLHLAEGEKLKCVSYAPYHRPGQTPFDLKLVIPREQIAADLAALARVTDCVRLYAINQGLDAVPEIAREVGLKVLLGTWIGFEKEKNAIELDKAIELANANTDVVRALIVGNEVLLRRERTEDEMRVLIAYAKARSQVPVTYADVWEFWVRHDSLAKEVDFITVHILPFWEDEPVDIEHALAHVADIRQEVGKHFAGKSILIGETGWPSAGRQREESLPSAVNQARYIREFVHQAHDRGWDYNLIEAIDQPWKRALEGTVGGYWGMLDATHLQPKFPLAGPVQERSSVVLPLGGTLAGAVLCLLLALRRRDETGAVRLAALTVIGAVAGLVAVLHAEHALLAYRNPLEWTLLGGIAALGSLSVLLFTQWPGRALPSAAQAWRIQRETPGAMDNTARLGLLRGVLLFAAAIAAVLLFADPRYRDFPSLLYLVPALLLGALSLRHAQAARAERICAALIAACVVFRWSTEPANLQAICWLVTGLVFALPVLFGTAGEDQKG